MEQQVENASGNSSSNGGGTIPVPTDPPPLTRNVKIEGSAITESSIQDSKQSWESVVEQSIARFMCHQCQKSFYNENALQNHKKVHHVFGDSSVQDQPSKMLTPVPLDEIELDQFKFYPLSPSTLQKEGTTEDGLTKCKFLEDTSFLIVTIREPCQNVNHVPPSDEPNFNRLAVDLRGPFTCSFRSSLLPGEQCRQIFFNCCEYSLHYREEHTKRRKAALRCQVCEKPLDPDTYVCNTVLAPPSTAIKVPKYVFSCRYCALTFSDSNHHEEHVRLFHARSKPHACMVCGKRFTQQGGLQQHMRMHSGIRPFACNFCPKTFTQKAGLEQHTRTHTKVKPFKCVVCDKCFSQSVHLRQHMRTHTNIQPFECSVCGKRFKQSSHLNFHVRSHMSELGSELVMDECAQRVPESEQLQLLSMARLHAIQEGESLYYGAELPATSTIPTTDSARVFPFAYRS